MNQFLNTVAFSFSITGPIFVMLVLGVVLARVGLITDAFIDVGSRLVFNVTLPSLLFISIVKTDLEQTANVALLAYGLGATVVVFFLLELAATRLIQPPAERGIVVQGAFRSNMGVIGLAYCVNAYGEAGLATASLYLALIIVLYNVLSVITLNRWLNRDRGWAGSLRGIARNPLIIGIVLALPVAWAKVPLPHILLDTGGYFAQMTLPLALLCTGGALDLRSLRHGLNNAVIAALAKLLVVPAVITLGGYLVGFSGIALGVVFLMASAPTAVASYIMVRSMGGNAELAANIVVLTTLGSVLATSLGVTLLRGWGLM